MVRETIAITVVALLLLVGAVMTQGSGAAAALEAAIRLETVDGDLRAAVRQYREIIARFPGERAIAARALLRLGGTLQKLGDGEASTAFEKIVNEYPEQLQEVNAARAALGQTQRGTERQIWLGDDVPMFAAVSPDGRSLAYIDYAGQRLALRDVSGGRTRTLVAEKDGWAEQYVSFAPDGRQIAYAWLNRIDERAEMQIRIARWGAAGAGAEVRVLSRFGDRAVAPWVGVYNWSRDGRKIAVQIRNAPHGGGESPEHEIGIVDVSTGEYTAVGRVGPRIGMGVAIAPGGTHIAYDSPASGSTVQRDIRVVPVAGGQEQLIDAGPGWESVVGWSADGRSLVYTSEVNGVASLYSQRFLDGKASGTPQLLRSALHGSGLAVTARGEVFLLVDHATAAVHVASADPATGRSLGRPVAIPGPRQRNSNPEFSNDGSHLAFVSSNRQDWGISERMLTLLALETQQMRMIPLKLSQVWTYDWSPDGRSFLARATDYRNRMGIYQIDAATGDVKPLLINGEKLRHFKPHWKDTTSFYYTRGDGQGQPGGGSLVLHDLSTGRETVILSGAQIVKNSPGFQGMVDWTASPDGRYIAGTRQRDVWLVSIADATARQVFRSERPIGGYTVQWTADSAAIYVMANGTDGGELWKIPVAGAPVRMELGLARVGAQSLSVHPDGRRLAVQTVNRAPAEIRVLDGVLASLR